MFRHVAATMLLLSSAPTKAETDELSPVPAQVVLGQSYTGDSAASKIRFVNTRARPVRLIWISFDGTGRLYATIDPGVEIVQPTYVAHRWVVVDAGNGQPLQGFISTRSAARDNGAAQIALIR